MVERCITTLVREARVTTFSNWMCDIHAQVEAEMEQILAREAREAEVYKRELSAWFKEQKKEQDESRLLEEHTAKERFKVCTTAARAAGVRKYYLVAWNVPGESSLSENYAFRKIYLAAPTVVVLRRGGHRRSVPHVV